MDCVKSFTIFNFFICCIRCYILYKTSIVINVMQVPFRKICYYNGIHPANSPRYENVVPCIPLYDICGYYVLQLVITCVTMYVIVYVLLCTMFYNCTWLAFILQCSFSVINMFSPSGYYSL